MLSYMLQYAQEYSAYIKFLPGFQLISSVFPEAVKESGE